MAVTLSETEQKDKSGNKSGNEACKQKSNIQIPN